MKYSTIHNGKYLEVEDIDTICQKLKDLYEYYKDEAETCNKQVNEWNKDEEIQKLKNEVKYIRRHSLLQMSDKEVQAEKAFREEHYKKCALPLNSKIKGNTYIYTLTGTGLGTGIEIQCPICGEKKDITDIDSW